MLLPVRGTKRAALIPLPLGGSDFGWHKLAAMVHCPKRYQFAQVRGIVERGRFIRDAFGTGLLVHAARAQWAYDDRKGSGWKKRIASYYEEWNEAEQRKISPLALNEADVCFDAYVKHWSMRPRTTVLAVEHELSARVIHPSAPEWAKRTARLDSVERVMGDSGAWIGECKTTAKTVGHVENQYLLHGQLLLQAALWGEEETKQFGQLKGILLDVIVKPSGKTPPKCEQRKILMSDLAHALTWFRKDLTTWVMQSGMVRWNDEVERRPIGCELCDFRELCLRGHKAAVSFQFKESGEPLLDWKPSDGQHVPPWV